MSNLSSCLRITVQLKIQRGKEYLHLCLLIFVSFHTATPELHAAERRQTITGYPGIATWPCSALGTGGSGGKRTQNPSIWGRPRRSLAKGGEGEAAGNACLRSDPSSQGGRTRSHSAKLSLGPNPRAQIKPHRRRQPALLCP